METVNVEPVFFKQHDYGGSQESDIQLAPYDVCVAVGRIIGTSSVDGAQNIGGIWRIYLKSRESRARLLIRKEVPINGKIVPLFDKNPALMNQFNMNCEKVTIKDLPLSVANTEIENFLSLNNVTIVSDIKYGKIRDSNGDLTNFKNGDRFVFVKTPVWPLLPRVAHIADIHCEVYHDGQFKLHCSVCNVAGHRDGDADCQARNQGPKIIPFRSQNSIFSNFYMCELSVFGKTFQSAEHAYQWKKAIHADMKPLAEKIRQAPHAGKGKRYSKEIPDEITEEWESKNIDIMHEIISAKASQVSEFKTVLIESDGYYLAEVTYDKLWANGLSPTSTERIDPKYFPGLNNLGIILMEVRDTLVKQGLPSDSKETDGKQKQDAVRETRTVSQSTESLQENQSQEQAEPIAEVKKAGTIKQMFVSYKDKAKRKPSKTPEKNKGPKIHKSGVRQTVK